MNNEMILDTLATIKEYRNTETYLSELLNREIPMFLNGKELGSSSRSLTEKT